MILAGFIKRNPSFVVKHARRMGSTRRAMKRHLHEHPVCAVTGTRRRLEVHHVIPCSVAPELADEPSNLMTLTRSVHRGLAHPFRSENYLVNIRDVVKILRIQRTTGAG